MNAPSEPFDPQEPLCEICNRMMELHEGCECSDVPGENICDACAQKLVVELRKQLADARLPGVEPVQVIYELEELKARETRLLEIIDQNSRTKCGYGDAVRIEIERLVNASETRMAALRASHLELLTTLRRYGEYSPACSCNFCKAITNAEKLL